MAKRTPRSPVGPALALALAAAAALLLSFRYRVELARGAVRALAVPMELSRSDVVFVVGGDPALLLPYALELLDDGYGREVWVVTEKVSENQKRFTEQFRFRNDQEYATERALIESRLPKERWRLLKDSVSTWTDVELLKRELDRRPMGSVLVVTSPHHSRRVRYCLRRIFGGKPPARFYYAYPGEEETFKGFVDPEKVVSAVTLEAVKNVAYRLKY